MKHLGLIFALLVTAAFVLSGNRGYALVIDEIVVNVPFSFTVDNTTLPAGHYVISTPDSMVPSLLEIHQENGDLGVLFLTEEAPSDRTPTKSELVFNRIGKREFLHQVLEDGVMPSNQLMMSSAEKKLDKEMANGELHRVPAQRRARR
jgi:hypothetical protein